MKSKALIVVLSVFIGLVLITGACSAGFVVGRFLAPSLSNPSALLPNLDTNSQNPADSSAATPQDLETLFKPFWQSWDLVHEKFVDQPVNDELLLQGAIRGMLESLGDQHTSYLDPTEFEISNAHLQGEEYGGIGAWVDISGDYLTIISPMPGSPAEKAGLLPDDKVIAIDGEDMTGVDGELARQKVIGPSGTTVVLTNPSSGLGTVIRMALEILLFRSLFRNTKAKITDGPRLVFSESKFLWLAALAFHWTFLFILLRHLRFFLEPVPGFVLIAQELDGFFQIGTPILYMTDLIIVAALAFLIVRRLTDTQIRYISLFADYFALFLLLGLALSGIFLRYFIKTDISKIKELAMGLVTFSPTVPAGLSPIFFMHIFLLSILVAYFPFSKLMHMGGVFLSPTRNLANNNRMKRHVNPWNYPVKVHTYEEWEEEFRDKIKAAGLPLDKV